VATPVEVYVVAVGDETRREAFRLCTRLRRAGIGAVVDLAGRAMRGQLRDADRSGARWALIVGRQELARHEVTLKDLPTGFQETLAVAHLEARLRS
jgi:histidyl-tRNA synthetase